MHGKARKYPFKQKKQLSYSVGKKVASPLFRIASLQLLISRNMLRRRNRAESYSETIRELGALDILEQPFAEQFSRMAKLRNVLVHLYDSVDMAFLASLVPNLIKDTKVFLKSLDGLS